MLASWEATVVTCISSIRKCAASDSCSVRLSFPRRLREMPYAEATAKLRSSLALWGLPWWSTKVECVQASLGWSGAVDLVQLHSRSSPLLSTLCSRIPGSITFPIFPEQEDSPGQDRVKCCWEKPSPQKVENAAFVYSVLSWADGQSLASHLFTLVAFSGQLPQSQSDLPAVHFQTFSTMIVKCFWSSSKWCEPLLMTDEPLGSRTYVYVLI